MLSLSFIHSNCFVLFHWLLGFPSFPGLLNPWCLVWGCAGRTPSRGCWTFASSYGTGGLFGAKMGLAVGLSAAAAGDLFWTRPGAQALTRCELRSEKHFHRRPALQAISLPASYMYWWVCHCWFLGLERNENCKKNSIDINVYKCAIPCHFAKSSLVILCLCCSIFVSRGVKNVSNSAWPCATMRDHWRGSRQGVFCAIGIGITPPRALAEGTIWAARCSLRCRNVPKIQSWTHQHWFLARGLFRVAGRASGVELEIAIVLPIPQMPRGCFRLSQSNTSRIDNGQIFPGDAVFFTCWLCHLMTHPHQGHPRFRCFFFSFFITPIY